MAATAATAAVAETLRGVCGSVSRPFRWLATAHGQTCGRHMCVPAQLCGGQHSPVVIFKHRWGWEGALVGSPDHRSPDSENGRGLRVSEIQSRIGIRIRVGIQLQLLQQAAFDQAATVAEPQETAPKFSARPEPRSRDP